MSSALPPVNISVERVAKMIDHSLLRPELTISEVGDGCELSLRYDVASVCVKPSDVPFAASLLAGTDVAVGHGRRLSARQQHEVGVQGRRDPPPRFNDGAREIDMVINIGLAPAGAEDDDVLSGTSRWWSGRTGDVALVKVILENAYLNTDEKIRGMPARRAGGRGRTTSRPRPGSPRAGRPSTTCASCDNDRTAQDGGEGRRRGPQPGPASRDGRDRRHQVRRHRHRQHSR